MGLCKGTGNAWKWIEVGTSLREETQLTLSEAQVRQLADKILLLPVELHDVLFFRFCFHSTPEEVERLLDTCEANKKLWFAIRLLGRSMGLKNGVISLASMEAGCNKALLTYVELNLDRLTKLNDAALTRELENLAAKPAKARSPEKPRRSLPRLLPRTARTAAALAVVVSTTVSSVLVADADLREHFFYWLIQKFPEFSIFEPKTSEVDADADMPDIVFGYMPEGFELQDETHLSTLSMYTYKNSDEREISIRISLNSTYLNTEDIEITPIKFRNTQAYWWNRNNIMFFVYEENGLSYQIVAESSYENTLKIAENITLLD